MLLFCIQYNLCESTFFVSVSDGWAFNNNIDISQHQSLEDRLSAADTLVQNEPLCPVVVDEMSNDAAIKYGAQPERLYVLQAGKVVYKVRSACFWQQNKFQIGLWPLAKSKNGMEFFYMWIIRKKR